MSKLFYIVSDIIFGNSKAKKWNDLLTIVFEDKQSLVRLAACYNGWPWTEAVTGPAIS